MRLNTKTIFQCIWNDFWQRKKSNLFGAINLQCICRLVHWNTLGKCVLGQHADLIIPKCGHRKMQWAENHSEQQKSIEKKLFSKNSFLLLGKKMPIFFIKWNEFVNGIGKEGFYLFFLVFYLQTAKKCKISIKQDEICGDKLHFFLKEKVHKEKVFKTWKKCSQKI